MPPLKRNSRWLLLLLGMCFKMSRKIKKSVPSLVLISLASFFFLISFSFSFLRKIDGIAALVNKEVITVTDLRIVKTFGLYDLNYVLEKESLYSSVLENMFSQKLVKLYISEDLSIDNKEIDSFLADLRDRIGDSGMKQKLNEFGIDSTILRDYCVEYLLYKKILSDRFSRSVVISIKEIEDYYNQVYVPEQRAKGEPVEPMVDILPKIEEAVKEKSTRVQIKEWLNNLRNKADIQIRLERYMDFLEEIESEKREKI